MYNTTFYTIIEIDFIKILQYKQYLFSMIKTNG